MNLSDGDIVASVLKGNTESFALIVERHKAQLAAAAYRLCCDAELTKDLVQDTFVEAFRQLKRLREPEKLRSWLFGILRNKHLQHLSRGEPPSVSWEEIEGEDCMVTSVETEQVEAEGHVMLALRQLPTEYREVLVAKYVEDLSYEEIARTLRMTVNNVRVRCCRAKERLRQLLATQQLRAALGGEPQ